MRGMISLPLTVIESDAELAGVKGKMPQNLNCDDVELPLRARWIRPEGNRAVPVVVLLDQGESDDAEVCALLNDLASLGFIALHLEYNPERLSRNISQDLTSLQHWLKQIAGCVHCNGRMALIAGSESSVLTDQLALILEPAALIIPRTRSKQGLNRAAIATLEVSLPLRSGRRSPQQYHSWSGPLQAVIPDLFHEDADAADPAQWASVLAFLHCYLD
ncbi:hypothetical protein [Marinobacterium jannaschii]|uniref:hypothetical protein n=1 Tax=Marinobacterium jannaschii TaxID=64970 RepID=UPI00047FD0AD|nr:hypothetical protein [Marinobacterium jannaschii]